MKQKLFGILNNLMSEKVSWDQKKKNWDENFSCMLNYIFPFIFFLTIESYSLVFFAPLPEYPLKNKSYLSEA